MRLLAAALLVGTVLSGCASTPAYISAEDLPPGWALQAPASVGAAQTGVVLVQTAMAVGPSQGTIAFFHTEFRNAPDASAMAVPSACDGTTIMHYMVDGTHTLAIGVAPGSSQAARLAADATAAHAAARLGARDVCA